MVLILLVAAVVGVIRLLEMLASNIIVVVVSITWLLKMLAADIIAAVFGITQLLEMLAGEYHGIQLLCIVAVALNCKNGISLDAMLVAANICT